MYCEHQTHKYVAWGKHTASSCDSRCYT